ncbi:thiamine phosphate synthase (plasmid) [Fulvitalea axinellae]|uniref:Thiamine phosphate synthase n=1 Tax=Fulvitalea axinellae TaxID=1182444 RepID=A0AAU9CZN0_9BACT|nr:thiamine phosphate synthase [Fulvitalea axinellae]
MDCILISSESDLEKEHELLNEMFRIGLRIFHLRKPSYSSEKMSAYLDKINPEYHSRIMIHSHHHLAETYGLRGIHFTEKGRKSLSAPYGSSLPASSGFHSLEALSQYKNSFEYRFLSPIFDSVSKAGYTSGFELGELRKFLFSYSGKIIALGGVKPENTHKIKLSGFSGFAVLGAVWQSQNPVNTLREFLRISEENVS